MIKNWLSSNSHAQGCNGFWFCSCAGLPIVPGGGGGSTATGRAPVIIRGKRARTVDAHAHCYFQAGLDLMGADAKGILPPVKGVPEHFLQMAQQLDALSLIHISEPTRPY